MMFALGGLCPHRRVLDATDGLVQTHAAVAVLVAGDAVADLLRATFPRLAGEIGVRDLSAHHADHVGLAVGQDPLRQSRIVDAPRGEHREGGHLFDARGQRHSVAQGHVHGTADQVQVVEGGERQVEVVEVARGLHPLGNLLGVLQIEAARDEFVGA